MLRLRRKHNRACDNRRCRHRLLWALSPPERGRLRAGIGLQEMLQPLRLAIGVGGLAPVAAAMGGSMHRHLEQHLRQERQFPQNSATTTSAVMHELENARIEILF